MVWAVPHDPAQQNLHAADRLAGQVGDDAADVDASFQLRSHRQREVGAVRPRRVEEAWDVSGRLDLQTQADGLLRRVIHDRLALGVAAIFTEKKRGLVVGQSQIHDGVGQRLPILGVTGAHRDLPVVQGIIPFQRSLDFARPRGTSRWERRPALLQSQRHDEGRGATEQRDKVQARDFLVGERIGQGRLEESQRSARRLVVIVRAGPGNFGVRIGQLAGFFAACPFALLDRAARVNAIDDPQGTALAAGIMQHQFGNRDAISLRVASAVHQHQPPRLPAHGNVRNAAGKKLSPPGRLQTAHLELAVHLKRDARQVLRAARPRVGRGLGEVIGQTIGAAPREIDGMKSRPVAGGLQARERSRFGRGASIARPKQAPNQRDAEGQNASDFSPLTVATHCVPLLSPMPTRATPASALRQSEWQRYHLSGLTSEP